MDAETLATTTPLSIAGVSLAVRDLHAVTAFYRDVIGLEVLAQDAGAATLGAGGVGFLDLLHRPAALPDDPRMAGLFHTAFLLPGRADLARWLGNVARRRTPLQGASDHLVSEAVYLADPEGNGVEVYRDRPSADWRWEENRVVMATDRLDLQKLLGEEAGAWQGAPAGTRIGHVHLRVGDVAQAADFYTGVVGMDVTRQGGGAVFLSSGGYHHHIAANVWESAGAGMRNPDMAGLVEVVLQAADADVAAGIAARGGAADPWGTRIGVRV